MNLDNKIFCDNENLMYVRSAGLLIDHHISNIQYNTKR